MVIERVLSNPAYAGLLHVTPFREHLGGYFPGIHEPIINEVDWKMVQQEMKKPDKKKVVLVDNLPLRGLLKCHCGNPLSGVFYSKTFHC